IYIIFSAVGDRVIEHIIPLSIGIFCTVSVVIISYLISVFVVKKINHIASSADAILITKILAKESNHIRTGMILVI
ncbi:hypothetical protein NAI47_09985, partial [Francisella tularensis subsp. holarctica]|uniref:hypothetical protein n=1 Tax=Francisella tularensis TaxID=263 RepID=UPI002381B6C2